MFIFSEASSSFIRKVKLLASNILKDEMKLSYRERVLFKKTYYPLNFIVFEGDKTLGFYDPIMYQIGLNKELMFLDDERAIKGVIRHELAHFYVHINFGTKAQAHGLEFREAFSTFNWDRAFSKSTIDLKVISKAQKQENNILEKIKKLLSLASSNNEFEAQLATTKANELITKHNISQLTDHDDHSSYVVRVLSYTRKNSKHDAIYEILKNFQVYPVFNNGVGGAHLEVIGSKSNVEIALYIGNYLDRVIDKIWLETKKTHSELKGIVAKNSFIRAFASSVCKELVAQQKTTMAHVGDTRSLVEIKNELQVKAARVYPRLRQSFSKAKKENKHASTLGSSQGKRFKIKPGLTKSSKSKKSLLPWLK